jgi:hypothetical protein
MVESPHGQGQEVRLMKLCAWCDKHPVVAHISNLTNAGMHCSWGCLEAQQAAILKLAEVVYGRMFTFYPTVQTLTQKKGR